MATEIYTLGQKVRYVYLLFSIFYGERFSTARPPSPGMYLKSHTHDLKQNILKCYTSKDVLKIYILF